MKKGASIRNQAKDYFGAYFLILHSTFFILHFKKKSLAQSQRPDLTDQKSGYRDKKGIGYVYE
jgi:hypothetical protein